MNMNSRNTGKNMECRLKHPQMRFAQMLQDPDGLSEVSQNMPTTSSPILPKSQFGR